MRIIGITMMIWSDSGVKRMVMGKFHGNWMNYNDLTTTSPEMIVSMVDHWKEAGLIKFSLVNRQKKLQFILLVKYGSMISLLYSYNILY